MIENIFVRLAIFKMIKTHESIEMHNREAYATRNNTDTVLLLWIRYN